MHKGLKTKAFKISLAVGAVLATSLLPARADGPADHQERRYVHVVDGSGPPQCLTADETTPDHNGACFRVPLGATSVSFSLKDDFGSYTGATDSRAYINFWNGKAPDPQGNYKYESVTVCGLPKDLPVPDWTYRIQVQLDQLPGRCGSDPRAVSGVLSADFSH